MGPWCVGQGGNSAYLMNPGWQVRSTAWRRVEVTEHLRARAELDKLTVHIMSFQGVRRYTSCNAISGVLGIRTTRQTIIPHNRRSAQAPRHQCHLQHMTSGKHTTHSERLCNIGSKNNTRQYEGRCTLRLHTLEPARLESPLAPVKTLHALTLD